jgi:hypothetical protein
MTTSTENPAAPAGREPIEPQPIKATFHVNNMQGIQVPDSLIPKGEDGKPLPAAPDPLVDRHIESYRAQGVAEDVLQQLRDRKPVSQEEYNLAQHRSRALKSDPAFVKRYLDNGVEERRIMATLSIILGSSIAGAAKK